MKLIKVILGRAGAYLITNLVDGRKYVGSAVLLYSRMEHHLSELRKRRHRSRRLQAAWVKHGEASFKFEILEFCESDQRLAVEQKFIDKFKCADPKRGYNLSPTAGKTKGVKYSRAVRARMAAAIKAAHARPEVKALRAKVMNSPEYIAKQRAASLARANDPRIRRKISAGLRRAMAKPDVKKRVSEGLKAAFAKPEVKQRLRKAMDRVRSDPSYGEKISRANNGQKRTQAAIARMKASWTPERRAKMSAIHKGKKKSKAMREKLAMYRRANPDSNKRR